LRIKTVWPGGTVEIPDPQPDEIPYRVLTTAKTPEDEKPKQKSLPEWVGEYIGRKPCLFISSK
jgi:hypothetical protein